MAKLSPVDMFPGSRKVVTQARNVKQRIVPVVMGSISNPDGLTTISNSGMEWAVRSALMVEKHYKAMAEKMTKRLLN